MPIKPHSVGAPAKHAIPLDELIFLRTAPQEAPWHKAPQDVAAGWPHSGKVAVGSRRDCSSGPVRPAATPGKAGPGLPGRDELDERRP